MGFMAIIPQIWRRFAAEGLIFVILMAVVSLYDSRAFALPAQATDLRCEAVFSGSFLVVNDLARLRVLIEKAVSDERLAAAETLYGALKQRVRQARESGFDLLLLPDLIEEERKSANAETSRKKQREERAWKAEELTLIDGQRLIFHPIEPGKFMMGNELNDPFYKIETEITKPFKMAATQTTQIVWRKVVERAKARFPGEFDALNDDPSHFKGDLNPVEQVSHDDVQLWLRALNELAKVADHVVNEVMPGHKIGEIYRLPTEAEWEFVVRTRGSANGIYPFGDSEADLGKYAWYNDLRGTTHRVATKHPLVIDGRDFYDLLGNVSEWTQDRYWPSLKGGKDPMNSEGGSRPRHVIRGGSWSSRELFLHSGKRDDYSGPASHVGFRVVTTLP
jgi:formylglycine-generating enzyme required for sulfatase activity